MAVTVVRSSILIPPFFKLIFAYDVVSALLSLIPLDCLVLSTSPLLVVKCFLNRSLSRLKHMPWYAYARSLRTLNGS